MNGTNRYILLVLGSIALLISTFFLGYCSRKCQAPATIPPPVIQTQTKYDTTEKIIRQQPINIYKQVEVQYVRDTLFVTKPFIAKLDTIIFRDTINTQFAFPQMAFSLALRRQPDTLKIVTIKTIDTRIIDNSPPTWVTILSHIGAGVLGFGAGRIK